MRQGFDNAKYIELQAAHIKERISQFGGKLYLEFGGKLFDDYHASRVLPGFEPDSKFRMLKSIADDVEVIIAINANHIEKNKARGDLGITYDEDVLRLVDLFRGNGFAVAAVVITQYAGQPAADVFRNRLNALGIPAKLHYPIEGYPHDVDLIVSDDGYGKNEFVETTRPLVVVTAPGPGSGKLATCLSQLYHEHKHGTAAGYAKFETFPVWNLPLTHPVIIAINANHIEKNKARGDLGITYDEDVLRLVDLFRGNGFAVAAVVITQYAGQPAADVFRNRLNALGIPAKLHYPIEGYPHDVDLIVSDDGYGKNEFVETTRPLVVVTAPGPGSGKLATCLSQLYHEHKHGTAAGYAKFETFPVWNLPLTHPVNIAYEAATADLDDANIIDSFHLEAYNKTTVNYNRDVEAFPVVRALMEKILGESPYQSPTDMGVNMVGFAITDDDACRDASKMEIVRRYFAAVEAVRRTGVGDEQVDRLKLIMKKAGIDKNYSPARSAALTREQLTGGPVGAMVMPDGSVVTGKTSTRLGAASSLIMNALKHVSGVDLELEVISDEAIEPISKLKTHFLGSKNPRLHTDETLMALSITSATSETAARVLSGLDQLRGCDAFFSVIISPTDETVLRKLGINVCCEPKFERHGFFHR